MVTTILLSALVISLCAINGVLGKSCCFPNKFQMSMVDVYQSENVQTFSTLNTFAAGDMSRQLFAINMTYPGTPVQYVYGLYNLQNVEIFEFLI